MELAQALDIFGLSDLDNLDKNRLKKIYRDLAKNAHPDSISGSNAKFISLQEAYNLLTYQIKINPTQITTEQTEEIATTENNFNATTDLDTFSKDTILEHAENLQKTLIELQSSSKNILTTTSQKVEDLINFFEKEKQELQSNLENSLELLNKRNSKWFGLFSNKNKERIYKEEIINNFTEQSLKLEIRFLKEIAELYGDGLNKINQNVDLIE